VAFDQPLLSGGSLADKTSARFKGDPMYCGIAVYRGSWEHPDSAFADAVRISVAKNDAPDFEMPPQTGIGGADVGSPLEPLFHDIVAAPPPASDDRERGWSSSLFPAKSRPFDTSSSDDSAAGRPAVDARKSDVLSAPPTPTPPPADGLFVPRSTRRSPP